MYVNKFRIVKNEEFSEEEFCSIIEDIFDSLFENSVQIKNLFLNKLIKLSPNKNRDDKMGVKEDIFCQSGKFGILNRNIKDLKFSPSKPRLMIECEIFEYEL